MTTSNTKSPQLRVKAGPDTTPTPLKKIQGFLRETEDDIMDEPRTTNSNNTQNKTTPTQTIPKTITENDRTQTNNQIPIQPGEATHTKMLQQGYNPLSFTPIPVNSHKSIVPTTLNSLHKQKLQQITSSIMSPLSNQTTKNYLKVCNAYNALNGQGTDGTLIIEKLETILVWLRSLGGY
jgi:hypothetical protein